MSSSLLQKPMAPLLPITCALLAVATLAGCEKGDSAASISPERHAQSWAQEHGRFVVFMTQELALLHPNSDRAKAARRSRLVLDEMLSPAKRPAAQTAAQSNEARSTHEEESP